MKFKDFLRLVNSDLYRYEGKKGTFAFLKTFFICPGFKYTCFMRLCSFLDKSLFAFPFLLLFEHYKIKYGISISHKTTIGEGFYIGHYGCIVVHPNAVIGKNCNISHEVTIGKKNRGKKEGYPLIGDNVYIAPGAKIIGSVKIGNNVAIGANCVVANDLEDNSVAVGIPAEVISKKGSLGYVNNRV